MSCPSPYLSPAERGAFGQNPGNFAWGRGPYPFRGDVTQKAGWVIGRVGRVPIDLVDEALKLSGAKKAYTVVTSRIKPWHLQTAATAVGAYGVYHYLAGAKTALPSAINFYPNSPSPSPSAAPPTPKAFVAEPDLTAESFSFEGWNTARSTLGEQEGRLADCLTQLGESQSTNQFLAAKSDHSISQLQARVQQLQEQLTKTKIQLREKSALEEECRQELRIHFPSHEQCLRDKAKLLKENKRGDEALADCREREIRTAQESLKWQHNLHLCSEAGKGGSSTNQQATL